MLKLTGYYKPAQPVAWYNRCLNQLGRRPKLQPTDGYIELTYQGTTYKWGEGSRKDLYKLTDTFDNNLEAPRIHYFGPRKLTFDRLGLHDIPDPHDRLPKLNVGLWYYCLASLGWQEGQPTEAELRVRRALDRIYMQLEALTEEQPRVVWGGDAATISIVAQACMIAEKLDLLFVPDDYVTLVSIALPDTEVHSG